MFLFLSHQKSASIEYESDTFVMLFFVAKMCEMSGTKYEIPIARKVRSAQRKVDGFWQ